MKDSRSNNLLVFVLLIAKIFSNQQNLTSSAVCYRESGSKKVNDGNSQPWTRGWEPPLICKYHAQPRTFKKSIAELSWMILSRVLKKWYHYWERFHYRECTGAPKKSWGPKSFQTNFRYEFQHVVYIINR